MLQKIREATQLYFSNLTLFSSIVLTVWLPASIVLVYLRLYVFPESTGGDELQIFLKEYRWSSVIDLAFGPIYSGAVLYAASQLKQGLDITYLQAMAHGARRSFSLLGTRIVTNFIVGIGFILLIIPGIVLALRFAVVDSTVVLDGTSGVSARNRSATLTQGKRWNILGTMILTCLGVLIAIGLTSFVLYFLLSLTGQEENYVVAVISECISSVFITFPAIVLFLFYWESKTEETQA